MKKVISAVLAAVMAAVVSIQALAAPSINGAVDSGQISADRGEVSWEEIDRDKYPQDVLDVVDKADDVPEGSSVKDVLGDLIDFSKIPGFDESSLELPSHYYWDWDNMHFLTDFKEIFISEEVSEDNPIDVTFTVNNMTDTMEVYVLYYCPKHGWEILKTTKISYNQVMARLHAGTSIMALLYVDKGANADNAEGTSPKTGDTNRELPMGIAVIALGLFGIYALKKSRKTA